MTTGTSDISGRFWFECGATVARIGVGTTLGVHQHLRGVDLTGRSIVLLNAAYQFVS
jgi:hypothetical protein